MTSLGGGNVQVISLTHMNSHRMIMKKETLLKLKKKKNVETAIRGSGEWKEEANLGCLAPILIHIIILLSVPQNLLGILTPSREMEIVAKGH